MAEETMILARYVAGLTVEAIPGHVLSRAKLLTLDLVGSAVRARVEADSTPSILQALSLLGLGGEGQATVMGDRVRRVPAVAALLNGALGHSLDFDDTHAASSLHPSAPVVPAALAAAELVQASGVRTLTAIVAGYEVCCRLGLALDPTAHYARGFHPTATAGTFGAAAAAGSILGLSAEQLSSAFGVAGSQAAGSMQFLVNGAWNKRLQVGAAAMNGLTAAVLAKTGFRGAIEALEGAHGFLRGYTDGGDPHRAVAGLGDVFETLEIGVKPYPSCRYTHAAVGALMALRQEHGIRVEEIERVEVELHRNGVKLTGEPLADKRRPRNVVAGQFSMPFAAAIALQHGRFGWDDYQLLGEPALDALCDRVFVRQSDEVEAGSPHPFGARVRIITSRGIFNQCQVDPPGDPKTFPADDFLLQKFLKLAEPVLKGHAKQLADFILSLDSANDLSGLASARP
jgi:2-methylcitrate dehydratase PrpD